MSEAMSQNLPAQPAQMALDVIRNITSTSDGSHVNFATIGEHIGKIMQTISGIEAVNPDVLSKTMSVFKYMVDNGGFRDITMASQAINDIAAMLTASGYSPQINQAIPAPTQAPRAKPPTTKPVSQAAPTPTATATLAPHVPGAPANQDKAEQQPTDADGGKKRKMRGLLGEDNPHLRPPSETGQKPAVNIRDSVHPDYIICLEDGKHMTMMKRHLRSVYGMTPEQYRQKWGLPPDYPMVAPQYALKKSEYAKQIGLGYSKQKAAAEKQPAFAD